MRYRSCIKLCFENARKVPPIVTESGITLNAPPPWNFATVTTCKGIKQIYRIVAIRVYFSYAMSGLHENMVTEKQMPQTIQKMGLSQLIEGGTN